MARFRYTPDQDVKVHEEGAIRLLCQAFQSQENGLPEWLKNSSDAYAREDAPEVKRVIVVIFDSGGLGRAASISCLDFSGMTTEMIEKNFRVWADPGAAIRGGISEGVQGGHGNGGKCYMTQLFEECAFFHSVKNNIGNRYGVEGGSIRFGYIPDRENGREFSVPDLQEELDKVLKEINCNLTTIRKLADAAIEMANGFTLVTGISPKGYERRIPADKLIESLQEHTQMIGTIELCKVCIVVNGKVLVKPLVLPDIQPMGGEQPRVIPIPDTLEDPRFNDEISTTVNGACQRGTLVLKTSDVSMRWKKKGRHNVIYKARSGYIGHIPVLELDIQSSYRDHIYGECYLESLEAFKTNERRRLADSPLTRAVETFISSEIQKYAGEFEARDRRQYDREEKNAISKMNEALDRWKNRFLDEMLKGMWGQDGVGPPPPQPPLPVGKPARLEVSLSHSLAGLGVSFRPTIKFFDKDGARIRPVAYHWVSEDNNVAMVDQDLMVVNTFALGETRIWAETEDGKVRSNAVPLQMVRILDIAISPREIEISVGTRNKLDAICRLADGQQTSDVYLEWEEDNSDIAKVSSAGLVFGFAPGETQVTAWDDKCQATESAIVRVVPGKGRGRGDKHGRGYPLVLVSGEIDRDPDTQEYRHFSKEYPPIAQDPIDAIRNIWWINSASPLAQLYLDKTKGYGYNSREWRMYHLERYIDVIVQIALTHGPTESESLSVNDWIMKWGYQEAQIQAAASADLREFIATGRLPE
jgi:hypothetical protein